MSGSARGEGFAFLALGDTPYTIRERAAVRSLIEAANAAGPAFIVHVGDFKSGRSPCTGDSYAAARRLFARFDPPLVYTPGDNEWTDCRRPAAGGFDPEERLSELRRTFFSSFSARSDRRLGLVRQSAEPAFADYVENARWVVEGVLFATLHVVGSNNNRLAGDERAMAEFERRSAANRAWLSEAFAEAERERLDAVVLFFHADPFAAGAAGVAGSGFVDFLAELAWAARAFAKPVLLVHGDGHAYVVDRPLRGPGDGAPPANVTRIEVFGSPAVNAVLVRVLPGAPPRFVIAPLIGLSPPEAGRRSGVSR